MVTGRFLWNYLEANRHPYAPKSAVQALYIAGQMRWVLGGQAPSICRAYAPTSSGRRSPYVCEETQLIIVYLEIYSFKAKHHPYYICTVNMPPIQWAEVYMSPTLPLSVSSSYDKSMCVFVCAFVSLCVGPAHALSLLLHQVLVIRCLLASSICVVHVFVSFCVGPAHALSLLCIRSL